MSAEGERAGTHKMHRAVESSCRNAQPRMRYSNYDFNVFYDNLAWAISQNGAPVDVTAVASISRGMPQPPRRSTASQARWETPNGRLGERAPGRTSLTLPSCNGSRNG